LITAARLCHLQLVRGIFALFGTTVGITLLAVLLFAPVTFGLQDWLLLWFGRH
jgi:type IV secretory pathway TrbD component